MSGARRGLMLLPWRCIRTSVKLALDFAVRLTFVIAATANAQEVDVAEHFTGCSAYFFMAANAKPMGDFNNYYSAGEYALNHAVGLVGEQNALDRFNAASAEINELIERRWIDFEKADEQYAVICADILRDATDPDK